MTFAAKPVYLLAGGTGRAKGRYDEVVREALRTTGVATPKIVCIGTANGDNAEFFDWAAGFLKEAGAGDVRLAPLCGPHANMRTARAMLDAADLVFVSGGDVEVGMQILGEHDMAPFLMQLRDRGTPFLGVSAGSIMLARQWIRWSDPDDDDSAGLFDALGIAPVLCDTHGEGDDWNELHALLMLQPEGTIGYGLPSGGAVCVWPDGRIEARCTPAHVFKVCAGRVVRTNDLSPGTASP